MCLNSLVISKEFKTKAFFNAISKCEAPTSYNRKSVTMEYTYAAFTNGKCQEIIRHSGSWIFSWHVAYLFSLKIALFFSNLSAHTQLWWETEKSTSYSNYSNIYVHFYMMSFEWTTQGSFPLLLQINYRSQIFILRKLKSCVSFGLVYRVTWIFLHI